MLCILHICTVGSAGAVRFFIAEQQINEITAVVCILLSCCFEVMLFLSSLHQVPNADTEEWGGGGGGNMEV